LNPEEARLSDFIKHHELCEIFADVEVIRVADNANPMAESTRPPGSVAASVVKLMNEVKAIAGRYPMAKEIVTATNDEVFAGLKQLSWGLLTASGVNGRRGVFKELLLSQIRTSMPHVENADMAHDRYVEEQKRDTELLAIPNGTAMKGHWEDLPVPDDDNQLAVETILSELDD
jgi:hypothetical protein